MATKIRPIVFKIDEPEGFVMNASNATISNNLANWEGPNYPAGYNGNGKTLQIIVKEEGCSFANIQMYYCLTAGDAQGPYFVTQWDNTSFPADIPVGTYTTTINDNVAGGDFGKYITLRRNGPDTTIDSTWLSKIEFRIID